MLQAIATRRILHYDSAMKKPGFKPSVIDLFSGVGGLSLGAARAGFRVAASVELDPIASKSHAENFPTTCHIERDVSQLDGKTLLEAGGLRPGELMGLIGGPPCQGFSLMGKRQSTDPRNDLFGQFFRLVSETAPAFYVAENVPGILSDSTKELVRGAMSILPKRYVRLEPIRVEAHRYGAPTTRTRVFFIGYDPNRLDKIEAAHFAPNPDITPVTVGNALTGLPSVRATWQKEAQSWRRIGDLPCDDYSSRILDMVPDGVGNAEALNRLRTDRLVSGFLGTLHTDETTARFGRLKPGEIDPVYRSPRLRLDGFCPTLRAGTNSDRGSYQAVRPIHPRSPRVITPREAARLQGFPDWFLFNPTKWHSFRQIGNSVSPIVAERLLDTLHRAYRGEPRI